MSSDDSYQNAKIAVALRTARVAAGWNQQEFADMLGVAKSTLARIETIEMAARADLLLMAFKLFKQAGIAVDLLGDQQIGIYMSQAVIDKALKDFEDESKRRADRKSKK